MQLSKDHGLRSSSEHKGLSDTHQQLRHCQDPMPGLWRTRVASFFAGSGLTALLAFGILRQDLQRQFGTLGEQVRTWRRMIDAISDNIPDPVEELTVKQRA